MRLCIDIKYVITVLERERELNLEQLYAHREDKEGDKYAGAAAALNFALGIIKKELKIER